LHIDKKMKRAYSIIKERLYLKVANLYSISFYIQLVIANYLLLTMRKMPEIHEILHIRAL